MGASKVVSLYKISQKESEPRGVTREREKQVDIYITFWGVRGLRFELVVSACLHHAATKTKKPKQEHCHLFGVRSQHREGEVSGFGRRNPICSGQHFPKRACFWVNWGSEEKMISHQYNDLGTWATCLTSLSLNFLISHLWHWIVLRIM